MKRFITYLYEYERGQKSKNTGFIRVDERNGLVNVQVSVRQYNRSHEKGKVFALVHNNALKGIEIGEVAVVNGQGDVQLRLKGCNIMDSGFVLDDVVGIGIQFHNNGYLASCWEDSMADEIAKGRIEIYKKPEELRVAEDTLEIDPEPVTELVTYQKMELNQIRSLPSPNWYLCNNRFLVHGFFNYGYLILKKKMGADGEAAYLGVPGVFEKPEMVMAILFGFPEFQALPKEAATAQMEEVVTIEGQEKNQEPKTGTFGCWLIPLEV